MRVEPAQFSTLMTSAPKAGAPSPLDLGFYHNTAGLIESRRWDSHRLALHVGPPTRTTCDRSGRMERRVQQEGEIDILPLGDHGLWIDESPALTFMMRLDVDLLDRVAADTGGRVVLAPGPVRDPGLEQIAWALKAELEGGEATGRTYLDGLALALCARLVARFGQAMELPPGPALSGRRLQRVKDFIEANLDRDLSLACIAREAGSSPSHFKVLFRRAAGAPLHQYIVRRRVERARELLERTDMPITEIAFEVGFAHPSHLARWTRRLLGATPGALASRAGKARDPR